MKTRYKHIHFVPLPQARNEWACLTNRENVPIAGIQYNAAWKQFIFWTGSDRACFPRESLLSIADFLKQLNDTKTTTR